MGNKQSTAKQNAQPPKSSTSKNLSRILPSKNDGGNSCISCCDIYHCSLELFIKNDEWIVVWPLLISVNHDSNDKTNTNYNNNSNDVKQNSVSSVQYTSNTSKALYLFLNKQDRDNQKLQKAMKTFRIPNGFDNIYEHYPFGINRSRDNREYYFILNGSTYPEYLFKCKNQKQRRLFINAILETIYYNNTNTVCKNLNNSVIVDNVIHKVNHKLEIKYRPVSHYMKQDINQLFNSIGNNSSVPCFNVTINISGSDTMLALSIRNTNAYALSNLKITMNELKYCICFMIIHYFWQRYHSN